MDKTNMLKRYDLLRVCENKTSLKNILKLNTTIILDAKLIIDKILL